MSCDSVEVMKKATVSGSLSRWSHSSSSTMRVIVAGHTWAGSLGFSASTFMLASKSCSADFWDRKQHYRLIHQIAFNVQLGRVSILLFSVCFVIDMHALCETVSDNTYMLNLYRYAAHYINKHPADSFVCETQT